MTGTIFLDVRESINASNIYLKIRGKGNTSKLEKVHFEVEEHQAHKKSNFKYERPGFQTFHQTLTFFNFLIPFGNFEGGQILEGQYEFPFEFLLPTHLDNSMFISGEEDKKKYLAQVVYDLKAFTFEGCNKD